MSDYSSNDRYDRDIETTVFQYVVALVFLWLLAGFWELQVRNPEEYEQRAERNSIRSLPIPAPRGKILDRDGRVLVDNQPAFRVLVSNSGVPIESRPLVSDGLGIPLEELTAMLENPGELSGGAYRDAVLKQDLTYADVAFFEAHKAELRELELIRSQRRLYPREGLAAHVVGYVGEISDRELKLEEFAKYSPGAEIGKAGIERQYNDALSGVDGSRLVLVDSRSRRVRDLNIVPAQPGRTIRLTIDLDLQAVAELAMEKRRGAVVVLDPRNGAVRAMVSRPAFDPNKFVGGIAGDDWRGYIEDPDKPMLNRATQAQLAPGSIFKPIIAMAALSSGLIDPEFQVHCGGGASFYGRFFRCHRAAGHGWVGFEEALRDSCDVFFYTVGKELGIEKIAEFSEAAGLGSLTGIDLPHEEDGIVPSIAWKKRVYQDRWWPGETISVAIGQGALTVTPLQAAYAIGGLVNGGVWHKPHLLSAQDRAEVAPDEAAAEPLRIDLRPRHLRRIIDGLWAVVNGGGTGGRAKIAGYDICGKTGTAQRVSRSYAQANKDPRLLDDGWFVAFAPCRAPEIMIATLFENGEHGSWAAPIARDIIKAHFDKRRRAEWAERERRPAIAASPAAGGWAVVDQEAAR